MTNRTPTKTLMTIAGAGALALAVAGMANAGDRSASRSLEGTWLVQVTLTDCTTGAQKPPFYSLLSFDRAGTLIETTNNPTFAPGQRSPGHGVWSYTGHRTFSASSDAFIEFSTAPNPPASPGFARGVQRIGQTITIDKNDEDAFDSVATVQFFDASGAQVLSACATAAGKRYPSR